MTKAGYVGVAVSVALLAGCAQPGSQNDEKRDYTEMSAEEYAEYLIFESGSFNLSQEVQEGGTARERMQQDELQRLCSETRNRPHGEIATRIVSLARQSFQYPEGGIQLGDWEKGRELARSGYGFRIGHNFDDPERTVGGNCYACHQMDPEELAYGNLGPSLSNYGELRGNTEAVRRFVYEMIYNPHAYFPCTSMPRMGYNEFITQDSISHIMAYLLDAESPVNARKKDPDVEVDPAAAPSEGTGF
ncbi:sulfur oxidation c-type cytochrome SoxX [Ectothiorhodospira variabilis]|uniref:sulfur oxidation c-type cytochrome SoxX n=1 Tax=Ectothiorhodospira variabilis TaxID=505694 RepID=UPI001EFB4B36|nr:sulfur oxidation c-type cytochrome SoxX [Ectothiorhodospira variabilis]MCG5498700.1 sulfur oxidation c-type cytochrome SoxX [Ectothiorhodospira variabilis]